MKNLTTCPFCQAGIHMNPVESGLVEEPEHYRYSSAIDYVDGKGLLDIVFL